MYILVEPWVIFTSKCIEVILNTMTYYIGGIYIKFAEKNIRQFDFLVTDEIEALINCSENIQNTSR